MMTDGDRSMRLDSYYIRSFLATWLLLGAFTGVMLYLIYLAGFAGLAVVSLAVAAFFAFYYRRGAFLSGGKKKDSVPCADACAAAQDKDERDGVKARARG